MRDLLRGLGGFLSVIFLCFTTYSALAAERVVMPYSCTVSGGVPRLVPSDDRGYDILGGRDQREFVACSPTRPNHCRKWNVHRFKIDCGGVTVPWVSVVAAGNSVRRAWLEGDQLTIRMPWSWIFQRHHPCVRMQNSDNPPRRLKRACRNRSAHAPESIVTMPPGFAPKFGIDAIFVKARRAPPALAGREPEPDNQLIVKGPDASAKTPKTEASETRNIEPPSPAVAEPPGSTTVVGIKPDTETAAVAAPDTAPAKAADVKTGEIKTAEKASKEPKLAAVSKDSGPSETKQNTSTAPIVINSIRGVRAGSTPEQSAKGKEERVAGQIFDVGQGLRAPPPTTSSVSRTDQIRPERVAGWWAIDRWDPLTLALVGIGGLATLFAAGRIAMRPRTAGVGSAASRDIASVSLGRAKARQKKQARNIAVRNGGETDDTKASPTGPKFSFDNTMPKSRGEALAVLGLSQTSDASQKAVKKIVDGLRLSWHPDHATDEDDRQLREARLKQINVAWEIIDRSEGAASG